MRVADIAVFLFLPIFLYLAGLAYMYGVQLANLILYRTDEGGIDFQDARCLQHVIVVFETMLWSNVHPRVR